MKPGRYTVIHSDRITSEVVTHLDFYAARRLVEHEENAGRVASMFDADEDPFNGLEVKDSSDSYGNGRYR